jgi:adenine-specific DNA-methyltransferase
MQRSAHRYRENGKVEKTLGAVYTPPRIAAALVRWAVRSRSDRVCDPACGEGVFLAAARTRLADLGNSHPTCVGVDVDPAAASAAGAVCEDFFGWLRRAPKFDVVVGNPPFIRSHLFPESSRKLAFQQMIRMGVKPSRLMSTWAPFVALSCELLSEQGRLALVVPEEILHINYAHELRRFLLAFFRRVILCLPTRDLFPSVQQSVVLLLCEKDTQGPSGLFTMRFSRLEKGPPYCLEPSPPWSWCSKWTHVFLNQNERQFLNETFRRLDWEPLDHYGRVEVGVVTGDNDFFLVSKDLAEDFGDHYVESIVASARDLSGIAFTSEDFSHLSNLRRPLFVLHTDQPLTRLPAGLRKYLEQGMAQGVHQRYKCRIREPWYAVPGIRPADALMLRQAGDMPRLVHLTRKLNSTDTIHRVWWNKPSLGKRHVVSFLNTLTLISCEILGRSYGGGVLELMPGEANLIPIPEPKDDLEELFCQVDERVRAKRHHDAIELVDAVVRPTWLSKPKMGDAKSILESLIARRKSKQNGAH